MKMSLQQSKNPLNTLVDETLPIKIFLIEKCNIFRGAIRNTVNKFSFVKTVLDMDPTPDIVTYLRQVNVILFGRSITPDECLKMAEMAKNQQENIGLVSLTVNISPDVANLLIKSGIHGILDEMATEKDLEIAIQASANGNAFSSRYIYEMLSTSRHSNKLTATELQVLSFLLKGVTNYQIAQSMCVSKKTIEAHLTRVYKKIGVSSRSQAIIRARELNLHLDEIFFT